MNLLVKRDSRGAMLQLHDLNLSLILSTAIGILVF
jgi:hypothetical protein